MNNAEASRVSLWRRLAAACYDALVLAALWMLTAAVLVPLSGGAITSNRPAWHAALQLCLLAVGYGFFGWFWTRDGQTLGMLAWRVKLIHAVDRGSVSWRQALIRYLAAIVSWAAFGLGFWWSLWDPQHKTWHDRLSGTELVRAPSLDAPSQVPR